MISRIKESLTRPLCQNGVPAWVVCIGLATVQAGFGVYPVLLEKYGNDPSAEANPLVLSFYRDMFCTPVLFVCAFVAERKLMRPSFGMLFLFLLLGLTMYSAQYLYILGVYHVGPTPTTAFQPAIPIWTSILAAVTCTEKLPSYRKLTFWVKFLGIFLAAGGAVDIVLTDDDPNTVKNKTGFMHYAGYLFLVGNTSITAIYILLQKRFIFGKTDNKWRDYPVSVTAYSYFFGATFMGLTSLQYVTRPQEYKIPLQSLYVLVYAIFITSGVCYLLLSWANSHVSSIVVTAFWPVQVLVTIIVAWFMLGDKFAPLQYVGAGVLILGLFLVLWTEYQDDREKQGKGGIISRISLDCGQYDVERQPLLDDSQLSPERTITENDVKTILISSTTSLPLSQPIN